MPDLRELFDGLTTLDSISTYMKSASSSDGETGSFELKGTNGKNPTIKDMKALFSKEICAFANTYGGLLLIHNGKETDIQPFDNDPTLFTSIESWLPEAAEPRLFGMLLREVEGTYLAYVPQSITKPHRSRATKLYYSRSETNSVPMDEITVAAMYRSQSVLSFVPLMGLARFGPRLSIQMRISNQSMVAGTKPMVHVQLFSSDKFDKPCWLEGEFVDGRNTSGLATPTCLPPPIGFCKTTSEFREQILYHSHHLSIMAIDSRESQNSQLRFWLGKVDCFFAEAAPSTRYWLFDLEAEIAKVLQTGDESQLHLMVERLKHLRDEEILQ